MVLQSELTPRPEATSPRQLSWTPPNASEFGLRVARILDDVWALYNMRLQRVDFSRDWIVEVNIDKGLSTFAFDELTQLVVRCHDACVRLTIAPCNMRYLRLSFYPRRRDGGFTERHPTMEQATERVRSRNYFSRRDEAKSGSNDSQAVVPSNAKSFSRRNTKLSDPDGLRAGVERLIAEWEHNERTLRPYDESTAQVLYNHVRELRALLAKHPPTPLADDTSAGFARSAHADCGSQNALCLSEDYGFGVCQRHASPPSGPSPVEQEKP